MPFHNRYVLRRDFPRRLIYRNAVIQLEIVKQSLGHDAEWILRAKKMVAPDFCVLATSRLGKFGFDTTIFNEGFVLDDQSPAGKIMERLVREGYAVSRPERVRA